MKEEFTTVRIKSNDLEWLRTRAAANHRSVPQEVSAIREALTAHLPAVTFTGKGNEIGQAFPKEPK